MVSPTCAAGWCLRAPSSVIWLDGFSTALHHQHVAGEPQIAGLRLDLGMHVGFRAVARARRLGDGVFHGGDDDAAVDRLFAGHRVGDLQ